MPLSRPQGVAIVGIYPCGKAQKNPPFPSRLIVSNRSSPSRVRFARGDELRHLVELREVSRLASPRWLDGFGRQRGKIAVSGRRHSHRDLFAAHPEPAQKCF